MTAIYIYAPMPDDTFNLPTVGTPISIPVAGGSEWFEVGVIISTERAPNDRVAIEVELAEGLELS